MKQGTPLSKYGEFGLIDHLTKNITLTNSSSELGVGDDAAILNYEDKKVVVTTDLLLEGIHFNMVYTPLKHLGYKAVVVNVSDVVAMNAIPKQITISLGISSKYSVEMLEEFYDGVRLACEAYGVDLVGGDTSASLTGLTISVTCIGEGDADFLSYRSGAKNTDLLCVTGDLGSAFMGLQLLEREQKVLAEVKGVKPDFDGYEYLLQRQLRPEARLDIIKLLKTEGIKPTSMIDISDGLSSELLHICKQSNVGCRIYEERVPIDFQTAKMAEEFNLNLITAALNGGEDYELLFTVPLKDHDRIIKFSEVRVIGHITDASKGAYMLTRDDTEIELIAQGWNSIG